MARVASACGETEERIIALRGIVFWIASVRSRDDR